MDNIALYALGALCLCLGGCIGGVGLVLLVQWYSTRQNEAKKSVIKQSLLENKQVDRGLTGWLILNQGPNRGSSILLDRPVMSIGRDPRNAIIIDHPQVSRFHARLTWDNARLYLEDNGSSNGTYLNQKKLLGRKLIENGDVIGLGMVVLMTYYQ